MGGNFKVKKHVLKERTLDVLRRATAPMRIDDLARKVRRHPTAMYRVVGSLEEEGRVRKERIGGVYRVEAVLEESVPSRELEDDQIEILRKRIEEMRAIGVARIHMDPNSDEVDIEWHRRDRIKLGG